MNKKFGCLAAIACCPSQAMAEKKGNSFMAMVFPGLICNLSLKNKQNDNRKKIH
jgi:hypothetical protein